MASGPSGAAVGRSYRGPCPLLVGTGPAGVLDQIGAVGRRSAVHVGALAAAPGDEPDVAAARVPHLPLLARAGAAGVPDCAGGVRGGGMRDVKALAAVAGHQLVVAAARVLEHTPG